MSFTDQLRALGRKPRVHPNGFIQLDLNDAGTRRLHVWRDDIPRQEQASPIHDHIFDMMSTIIKGRLVNVDYELVPGDDYDIYVADYVAGGSTVTFSGKRTSLQEAARTVVEPLDTYVVPAFGFHESSPLSGTSSKTIRAT